MRNSRGLLSALLVLAGLAAEPRTLTIMVDAPGKPISPDLFGNFFEDLNYVPPASSFTIFRLPHR